MSGQFLSVRRCCLLGKVSVGALRLRDEAEFDGWDVGNSNKDSAVRLAHKVPNTYVIRYIVFC